MKINDYIRNLKRGAGADRAVRIAESRMRATDPRNFVDLPAGVIFFPTDVRQQTGYRERELRKLHEFWKQVYHIIKKERS